MKTSENGIKIIKRFEGCKLESYKCPSGIQTIGYGHTKGVKQGDKCTQEQALEFLKQDIEVCERAIAKLVTVQLNQNQFDALVSFTYNLGITNFKSSTMLKYINAKQFIMASNEFPRWVYSNGKKLKGLEKRRKAEKDLFLLVS